MLSKSQSAQANTSTERQVSSVISTVEEKRPLVGSITESKETVQVPQRLTSKPPIILLSPAQKAEHLIVEGSQLLTDNALGLAEAKYAEALKEIYHQEDAEGYKYHLESIVDLAKVYEREIDEHIKATALYNYALNICADQKILEKLAEQEKSYFTGKIPEVKIALSSLENNFIAQLMQRMGKQFFNPYPYKLHNKLHKDQLEAIRAYVDGELKRIDELYNIVELFSRKVRDFKIEEKWAKEIRDLYHNIAEKMKKFIRDLWQECIDTLGEPPCKYAVIGLGSLAREEMTPYSDLEFAILIEAGKDTEVNKQYFRNLTNLLHLKIINLSETILPAITIFSLNNYYSDDPLDDWFYDNITPRGFAFDGAMPKACKTPLGRKDKDGDIIYELIQAPVQMASFISETAFRQEQTHTLSMILPTFTYICGDPALVDTYRKNVAQILDEPVNFSEEKGEKSESANLPNQKIRERRALNLLKVDLEKFDPKLKLSGDEGKLLAVKNEIYRLPNIILDNLALFYGIVANSSWTKIEALQGHENFHLHFESALHLKRVCSITTALRLRIYQHYHAQRETLSALFKLRAVETISEAIPQTAQKVSHAEYYALEQEQLTIFTEIYKTLLPLHTSAQEFIAQLFVQDQETIFQTAVLYDTQPIILGSIANRLCDYQSAASYFKQAVKIEPENAALWNALGAALSHLDKPQETLEASQQFLSVSKNHGGLDHVSIAIARTNLGIAYVDLGNIQKGKELLEQALKLIENYYGCDYYEVVIPLVNLGEVYRVLKNAQRAKELLERALAIQEKHYGTNHCEVARILVSLGNVYGDLEDDQRAKKILERALVIDEKHYGLDHYEVARILVSLGVTYGVLGDFHRQKELFERALAIQEKHHGLGHSKVAMTRFNLGYAYLFLKDDNQAKKHLKFSHQVFLKFFGPNDERTQKAIKALQQIPKSNHYESSFKGFRRGFLLNNLEQQEHKNILGINNEELELSANEC